MTTYDLSFKDSESQVFAHQIAIPAINDGQTSFFCQQCTARFHLFFFLSDFSTTPVPREPDHDSTLPSSIVGEETTEDNWRDAVGKIMRESVKEC